MPVHGSLGAAVATDPVATDPASALPPDSVCPGLLGTVPPASGAPQ
jgi:hypothetical protein